MGEKVTKTIENKGKRSKYAGILFDADNTLFDFDAAEDFALRTTMERRNIPWSEVTKNQYLAINRPLWDAFYQGKVEQKWLMVERFRRFSELLGVETDPKAWDEEYLELLGESSVLIDGAEELLRELKPHFVLVLATNGETEVQKKRLGKSSINGLFDGVFISKELGMKKPEKAYFHHILKELRLAPEETLMVGDNLLADIQGAINAGIDSVLYSPDIGKMEILAGLEPTYRVGRLEKIKDIVWGEKG